MNLEGANVDVIRFKRETILVELSLEGPRGGKETVKIETKAEAHPDLLHCRRVLGKHIAPLCEVADRDGQPVTLSSVKFKRNSEEALGAVLTGWRPYENSLGIFLMNTPVHYVDDENTMRQFTEEQGKALFAFRDEVIAYIGGKTAQGDLFEDAVESTPDEEEA